MKKLLLIMLCLPLFAQAQVLPIPTQDNQTFISKQNKWVLANASLNLGSKYLIGISQTTKLLDTVTNQTGMYFIRGVVNPTTLPAGGVCFMTVDYTDEAGKLQQNVLLYQMRVVGRSNWGGMTLIATGGTRIVIKYVVSAAAIGNGGCGVSEVAN